MLLDFRSLSFTTGQLSGETQNIRLHTIYGLSLTQNFFFENEFNSNQTVFGWFVEVNGGLVEIVVFIQSKDIYRFQDSVGYST